MLVLSRRAGEKIAIGNDIVIEVLSVNDGNIRLGIQAPRETSVHRFEVFSLIEAANRAAEFTAGAVEEDALKDLASRIALAAPDEQKNSGQA